MVYADQVGSLFFQVAEVVDNGCIEIGFDPSGKEVFGAFTFSQFSELDPMLRLVMLVQFGFSDSI